jgi:hypothetical protein
MGSLVRTLSANHANGTGDPEFYRDFVLFDFAEPKLRCAMWDDRAVRILRADTGEVDTGSGGQLEEKCDRIIARATLYRMPLAMTPPERSPRFT